MPDIFTKNISLRRKNILKCRILRRAPGREHRAAVRTEYLWHRINIYFTLGHVSFCLSVCASVDIWAANIRSHFRFQLSVQKLWIPSPQLRIILRMNGLAEQPRCMSRGIWFTSLVLMYWRKGAGMGCECCCHCFIRHVKTSSHRNKLLSQHPGLITPRIPARGSRGRRGECYS